jgi:mannose-1-phosphate guanylyltransferase
MTAAPFPIAVILAAGRGERMRPLSSVVPKPALDLPDGPVISSAMRLAAAAGVERIVVNTWYLAHRMARAVAEVNLDLVEVVFSEEQQLMGSAGGLALARQQGLLGRDGPILVINGDGVLGLDIQALATRYLEKGDAVTLALLPHLDPSRWSRVVLDTDGHVEAIRPPGRPDAIEAPFLYPGVMVVGREALDTLPARPSQVPELLWGPAQAAGKLGGVVVAGHWREVGTPSDYLEVVTQRLAGNTSIHATASVDPSASLADSFVARHAEIEAGAVVENSVVGEGAVIRRNARVVRSVLLGDVEAAPGELIEDEIRACPTTTD